MKNILENNHIFTYTAKNTHFLDLINYFESAFFFKTHYARPNSPVMNHLSKYIDYSVYVFKYLVIFPNGLYPVHF